MLGAGLVASCISSNVRGSFCFFMKNCLPLAPKNPNKLVVGGLVRDLKDKHAIIQGTDLIMHCRFENSAGGQLTCGSKSVPQNYIIGCLSAILKQELEYTFSCIILTRTNCPAKSCICLIGVVSAGSP